MKKILSIALVVGAVLAFSSCSDEQYSKLYNDPSGTSTASCDKLFTGVVWNGRTYGMQTYWGLCTWNLPQIGAYSQIASHFVSDADYEGTGSYVSYGNDRWTGFYTDLAQYKLMRYLFSNLSESEQASNQLYMDCATVWIYNQLEMMVDLWGDVPFINACNIQNTADIADSKVAYDDAEDLYNMMLNGGTFTTVKDEQVTYDGLGTLYSRINSATTPSGFASQDLLFGGDKVAWARYALGLRARMALRVATQGDLTSTGRSILTEIASQLASFSDDCVTGFSDPSVTAFSYNDGNGMNWAGGWNEWSRQYSRLTYKMAEVLNLPNGAKMDHNANVQVAGADPRAAVMYDASDNFTVHIMDYHDNFSEQYYNQWRSENTYRYFAVVDSATFLNNAYFMHPIMTKAEVFLTLAEAAQRGYISGSAENYFKQGVQASIDLYYAENAKSTYRTALTEPNATEYINNLWNNSTDKLKTICEQRWLHFSFLQPEQCYSEVRRTGYPELEFRDYTGDSNFNIPLPMDRILYPSDEINYNSDNMQAAEAKLGDSSYNHVYNAIFWAKGAKSWYKTVALPYN